MNGIAGQDDGAHLRELDEQAGMTRRMARRAQHDHRAVTEHILVLGRGSTLLSPLIQLSNGL